MKYTFRAARRLLSLALTAALLSAPVRVLASEALGHDLALRSTRVAEGVQLAAGTFWSDSRSDLRQENYVVYTPGGRVKPVVTYGETTRSMTAVPIAAGMLEEQGWRVVAGINGDYYSVQYGVPLGCTMVDGELRNANGDLYRAVGFREDGSAVIGYPKLSMHVAVERPEPEPVPWTGTEEGLPYDDGAADTTAEPPAELFEQAYNSVQQEPYEPSDEYTQPDSTGSEQSTEEPAPGDSETNETAGTVPEEELEPPPPPPEDFDVFAFNHIRQTYFGIFLYDHRFNERGTTGTSEPGTDVICSVRGGGLRIGGALELTVDEVRSEVADTEVPYGKYVLSANDLAGEGTLVTALSKLRPGDLLTLSVTSGAEDADWNGVVQMLGAPELLVEHGAVAEGLPTGSAPRTAVGQRSDGSLIFYTIDGRRPGYSVGASLTAVAMRLVELGCETAVALDGGGSTTLAATLPHETAVRTVNSPSDGAPRAVTNQLFLVEPNTPSGLPDHIYLAPSADRLLPKAEVSLTAAVIDSCDIPMATPVALRSDLGFVEGNVLTAPDMTGTVTVTAESGGLSASVPVEVLLPDTIVVRRGASAVTSLILSPEESISLTAEGILNHLPLVGDNRCFSWTYEGDGVTLSEDGATLTAGETAGAGTLTVSVGDRAVLLPVTVSVLPLRVLDDFEEPFEQLTGTLTEPAESEEPENPEETEERERAPLTLTHDEGAAHIRFGRAAACLDYTLPENGAARLDISYAIPSEYNRVELWVLGDGSTTSLALETDRGLTEAVPISFTGWGPVTFLLPAKAKAVTGLTLRTSDEAFGTLWLDQLVLGWDGAADTEPPAVSLTLDEETGVLTGRAFDAVNAAALPTLRLNLDGEALDYSFDARTGQILAALPESDGRAHIITLTAGDAAGHLARTSVYIPSSELLPPAFPDLEGHWAAGAAEYLLRSGVTNGSNGLFLPDADITRQEFATMLYRWLGLGRAEIVPDETPGEETPEAAPEETAAETTEDVAEEPEETAEEIELPFYDTEEIAPWALDAARAMYSRGIVMGGKDAMGKLRYNPGASITRQEAATMLGRMVEHGYTVPPLSYADAEDIQSWAAEHVALLASFGVFDDLDPAFFDPTRPLTRGEMASLLLRMR